MARGQTISSMVFNKPQLISLDEMQPIINYLQNPSKAFTDFRDTDKDISEVKTLEDFGSDDLYERYKLVEAGINPDTMVGTLNISGALTYRSGVKNAECTELTSYEKLKKQTESMVEHGAQRIVLMVDSGGGMAHGNFAAANYISKITKSNNIETVAYVDGAACSGGLALAVLADKVILNPDSRVGSIGVVVSLYNDSKMLENAGVSRQFVFAGDNKVPFSDTGEFTETFISDLQKSVDKTYTKFVKHITNYREISEQDVIDTQAGVFDADEAIRLGLADEIMELEDFELKYGLKVKKGSKTNSSNFYELSGDNQSTREGNMPDKKVVTDESLSDTHETKTEVGLKDMPQDTMSLADLVDKNTELNAQLAEYATKLKASNELNEQLSAEIAQKDLAYRTEQRKLRLEDALGKDNESIEELLDNTESLSDAQFDVISASLSKSQVEKEKQLEEKGGEGQESDLKLSLSEQIANRAKEMNARKA